MAAAADALTAALLLLYYCFTTALLLLYYCFTTSLLQGAFIEAMTAAAGVLKEDVSIKSVREVGSARRAGTSARRAGTSATLLRLTYADVCCVC